MAALLYVDLWSPRLLQGRLHVEGQQLEASTDFALSPHPYLSPEVVRVLGPRLLLCADGQQVVVEGKAFDRDSSFHGAARPPPELIHSFVSGFPGSWRVLVEAWRREERQEAESLVSGFIEEEGRCGRRPPEELVVTGEDEEVEVTVAGQEVEVNGNLEELIGEEDTNGNADNDQTNVKDDTNQNQSERTASKAPKSKGRPKGSKNKVKATKAKHQNKENVSDQVGDEVDSTASSAAGRRKGRRPNGCGACAACGAQDCQDCRHCKDKPKFGGKGRLKQKCLARVCPVEEAEKVPKKPLKEQEGNTKKPENNEVGDKKETGDGTKKSGETGKHEDKSKGDNKHTIKEGGKKTKGAKETEETEKEIINEKEASEEKSDMDNLNCKICDVVLNSKLKLKAHMESSKHHRAWWSKQVARAARKRRKGNL